MSKREFNTTPEIGGDELLAMLQNAANANFTTALMTFKFIEGETGTGGNDAPLVFAVALIKNETPE